MQRTRRLQQVLWLIFMLPVLCLAQEGGSVIINKDEVDAVFRQGLTNLSTGRNVSDIVVRHVDASDVFTGVSIVQRNKKEITPTYSGIAHPDLDETYYIVSGEGTMVTGGELVDVQSSVSNLLGPMQSGQILGGILQKVKPGDIAIIPKGMPHGWHEIVTDSIGYIIFRGDPHKVMAEKYE